MVNKFQKKIDDSKRKIRRHTYVFTFKNHKRCLHKGIYESYGKGIPHKKFINWTHWQTTLVLSEK